MDGFFRQESLAVCIYMHALNWILRLIRPQQITCWIYILLALRRPCTVPQLL